MIFLLDMDDTLLDFQKLERLNLIDVLSSFGISAGEEEARLFHTINDGLWKALERGEIERPQIVTKRFELLFRELGVLGDAKSVAEAYFQGLAERCFPFEGMTAFLEALRARGDVYIVTNGAAYVQRRHLTDAGILPFVSGVFISDEIGANKPAQPYCDYVAAHIPRFGKEKAVYIGDSLTSDRICAERLGVPFILYAPHGAPAEYTGKIAHNYQDVLRLFTE